MSHGTDATKMVKRERKKKHVVVNEVREDICAAEFKLLRFCLLAPRGTSGSRWCGRCTRRGRRGRFSNRDVNGNKAAKDAALADWLGK